MALLCGSKTLEHSASAHQRPLPRLLLNASSKPISSPWLLTFRKTLTFELFFFSYLFFNFTKYVVVMSLTYYSVRHFGQRWLFKRA